jgi:hypothetical protein
VSTCRARVCTLVPTKTSSFVGTARQHRLERLLTQQFAMILLASVRNVWPGGVSHHAQKVIAPFSSLPNVPSFQFRYVFNVMRLTGQYLRCSFPAVFSGVLPIRNAYIVHAIFANLIALNLEYKTPRDLSGVATLRRLLRHTHQHFLELLSLGHFLRERHPHLYVVVIAAGNLPKLQLRYRLQGTHTVPSAVL